MECSQEILSMAENTPITRIPQHIQTMIEEKQELVQELRILRRDVASAKKEREDALKNSQTSIRKIREFVSLEDKLSKFGLSFDNLTEISKLTMVLDNVKGCSFDTRTIAIKLSSIDNLEQRQLKLHEGLSIEQRLEKIISKRAESENKLYLCQMRLGLYDQLERMGCGLKELTILRNTILEIAKSNSINPHFAVKKFCCDIKDQYDAKLGLEKKVEEMNKSSIDAQQEFRRISLECSKLKDPYDKLGELFEYGVSQNDIVHWNSIVKGYTKDLSSMNQDLRRYGGLVKAKARLETLVKALRLEQEQLTAKIKVLKEEFNEISLRIEFEMSYGRKITQVSLKDLEAKISETNKSTAVSLQTVQQQSLFLADRVTKGLQTLDSN